MRPILPALALLASLGACAAPPPRVPAAGPPAPAVDRVTPQTAAANALVVVERVEPVAESVCLARAAPGTDCDFQIVVLLDPQLPPNAFQTEDRRGRPVIGFTRSLIADARNRDEIAFVMSHEAAHHIEGHLGRRRDSALAGRALFETLAERGGATPADVRRAAQFGLFVGSRRYSKEFELEADSLGAVITARSGFDPVRGAAFFTRSPDPGDRFLGTHPPNAARVATVRAAVSGF